MSSTMPAEVGTEVDVVEENKAAMAMVEDMEDKLDKKEELEDDEWCGYQ